MESSKQKTEMSSIGDQLIHSIIDRFEPKLDAPSVDMNGTAIKRYVCEECGDTYLFESSINTHFERKSVNISYSCEYCATKLAFFNRCALLQHIRNHNQTHQQIESLISQVFVSPLPLSTSNQLLNGSKQHQTNDQNKNHLTKCNDLGIAINGNEICRSVWKCSECFVSLDTSLKTQHFSRNNKINGNLYLNACKICGIICSTKCSQTIHNRLHNQNDNPLCPECGESFQCNDVCFIIHVILNCHHFCRKLVYQCIYCSHRLSCFSSFAEHIKSFHTKSCYLCSHCGIKFNENHELKAHQLTTNHNQNTITLYKCPICNCESNTIKTYCDHVLSHQNKLCSLAKFIFACCQCNQSFNSKNELSIHINNFHELNKTETERNIINAKLIRDICNEFKLKIELNEITAKLNVSNLFDQFSNVKHKLNDTRSICSEGSNGLIEKSSTNKVRSSNMSKSDNNLKIYAAHVIKNSTNDKLFKCNECEHTFSVLQTLKRHLILEHSINDVENYINKINLEKLPKQKTFKPLINEDSEKRLSEILENKNSTESTCPVCLLTFPNVQCLKIHGRVHGMAFIKSCQKKAV